jgi:branched-chain amino acid aminotransferase
MNKTIRIDELPAETQVRLPQPLGFGRHFARRMFRQIHTAEQGWHDARICAFAPLALDPAAVALHYGQSVFEGCKAYRRADGDINLFRVDANAARFNASAERLAMPAVDVAFHCEAIRRLVLLERDWVPSAPGASLYIRPVMLGVEPTLEVRSAREFIHYVIVSPVGAFFPDGFKPIAVQVAHDFVRASPGGTGAVKTGGNYGAGLLGTERARAAGYQQVLWLDGAQRRYVEEVGAMNIAFVYGAKHIRTPRLSGSILPGVTRDSILCLAPELGFDATEERIDIEEVVRDIERGDVTEVFGMGTAAVVAPIGRLGFRGRDLVINQMLAGPVAGALYQRLTDIQYGRAADSHGWVKRIEVPEPARV